MIQGRRSIAAIVVAGSAMALGMPRAQATGIPVIDVAAIAQLAQQVMYWQEQIQGMTKQLNQMKQSYQAITGNRGMERLMPMSNAARNYLPGDTTELMRVMDNTSPSYSGLSAQVQTIVNANAVLSGAQVNRMSPQQRRILQQGRQAAAMLQMIAQEAQRNTSQRFGALQQLINAVGGAGDDKAIQDLQGRIAAEQNMLTVEQTKLQALYQVAHAQEMQRQQMVREGAVQSFGTVASARRPVFP